MDSRAIRSNRYVATRAGEKDPDDFAAVVEYSNISQEMKEFCIKLARDALSKYIFYIRGYNRR